MAKSNVTFKGADHLVKNFVALERAAGRRELDGVFAHALEPLRSETEARAPRRTLKRGVVIAKRSKVSQFVREFWVSFKRGDAMRIAHLIEFGTAPHSLARGASRRKNFLQDQPPFHPGTRPHPFFRPAFESTKDEVFETAGRGLWALMMHQIS